MQQITENCIALGKVINKPNIQISFLSYLLQGTKTYLSIPFHKKRLKIGCTSYRRHWLVNPLMRLFSITRKRITAEHYLWCWSTIRKSLFTVLPLAEPDCSLHIRTSTLYAWITVLQFELETLRFVFFTPPVFTGMTTW